MTQAIAPERQQPTLEDEFREWYRRFDDMQRLLIETAMREPQLREHLSRREADLRTVCAAVQMVDPSRPPTQVRTAPWWTTRVRSFFDRDLDILETIGTAPPESQSRFGRAMFGRRATRFLGRLETARLRTQDRIGALPIRMDTEETNADRLIARMTEGALELTRRVWTADRSISEQATRPSHGARRRQRGPAHARETPTLESDIQTFVDHANRTEAIIREWITRSPLPDRDGVESFLRRRIADIDTITNRVATIDPRVQRVSPVRIGDGNTPSLFDSPTLAAISTPNPDQRRFTQDQISEHMTSIYTAEFALSDALSQHSAHANSGPWHVGAPHRGIPVMHGPDPVDAMLTELALEALSIAERRSLQTFGAGLNGNISPEHNELLARENVAAQGLESRVASRGSLFL